MLFVNPRSGSCLAARFLTDYDREHIRLLCLEDKVIACKMQIYDVTSKDDRAEYTKFLEKKMP